MAYATMNVFIYYFWWDKPKDVECPIRVYKSSEISDNMEEEEVEVDEYLWGSGVFGILERIWIYLIGVQDDYFLLSGEIQVPMFWSGKPEGNIVPRATAGAMSIGMAFGAIHFIAWNSKFPSDLEHLLWRISSIVITAVPLMVVILCSIDFSDWGWMSLIISVTTTVILLPAALLYCFVRISTLVIAFTTLRALPLVAFQTVDWATFIPHL